MNIHGARSLAPSVPFQPFVVPVVDSPTLSLASSSLRVSLRTAPRPICHPLRYPSNGYQSKAEITIRVCPVDEVDSNGRAGQKQIEREKERQGGSDAYEGRGTSQWSLPLNWKLRFRPVKCRFSPPRINEGEGPRRCFLLLPLPSDHKRRNPQPRLVSRGKEEGRWNEERERERERLARPNLPDQLVKGSCVVRGPTREYFAEAVE